MKPSSLQEKHLSIESLEPKQLLSGTALAAVQGDTAYLANAALRDAPVELLSGTREFDGSTVETIADSPVFTDGSFTVEISVRPDAIRSQTIFSKYDSGTGDTSFELSMLKDGRLQFDVYGNPTGQAYLVFRTTGAPLTAGQWQNVRVSFDLQNRQSAIMVDGKDIPGTMIKGGADVTVIHDGESPFRLGVEKTGGGLGNIWGGGLGNGKLWPIAQFRTAEEARAAQAAIVQITETEGEKKTPTETITDQNQLTAVEIDAVLRAPPVELLKGTREFDGSQMVSIADSPVFTDGSFTVEAWVRPDVLRFQTIFSKHDTQNEAGPSLSLRMLADGRLEFDVTGNPATKAHRFLETNSAPLTVGTWHKVAASFDITNQKMSIMVDGKEVPSTLAEGSQAVPAIFDSTCPMLVGASKFGGGLTNYVDATIRDMTFYPVAAYGIPEEAPKSPAATDAVIAEVAAEEETIPETVTAQPQSPGSDVAEEQQITASAVATALITEDTPALRSAWNREQAEFRIAEGRTSALLDGIAEDRDALGSLQGDLAEKRTVLAEKETSLKQCQDALQPLATEAQRLTDLTASLTSEQQGLPGRIAALQKQITDGQKALKDTIAARDNTERTLDSTQRQYIKDQKAFPPIWKAYLKNSRNQSLRNQAEAMQKKLADAERQIPLLQNQFAALMAKVVEWQNFISTTTNSLVVLQQRQAALPAELQRTITARDAAETQLGALPGEETQLTSEIAGLRAIVDAETADAALLSQRIANTEDDLPAALLTEAHEWQDVDGMRRTVDAALLAVFEEDCAPREATKPQVESTEEAQSLPLMERQIRQYETRMAAAEKQFAECDAVYVSSRKRVRTLEQMIIESEKTIAQADEVLTKAKLEADIETGKALPSFQVDGIRPNRTIWLNYSNMPEGYDAVMWGNGFGEREAIPAGSGTVDFGIPQGIAADAQIGIVKHGTNEVIGELVPFRILKGYVRENVDDARQSPSQLKGELTVSPEEAAGWQRKKEETLQTKAAAEARLPGDRAREAQALLDWQLARRETIAYAQITSIEPRVEELRNGYLKVGFTVHYRSPDTDSCLEVYRDGVRVNEFSAQHPAGEPDGQFWFNPGDSSWNGDLEFKYSSRDEGGTRQVDSAMASYNTRDLPQNAARVSTTFSDVESHDTGRLVDHPLPYELKIMSVNGPNAVLHFTSPDDESLITSTTGGLYGQELRSHPGGTSTGVTLITLNASKPGRYFFSLMDQNGWDRATVWVEWNGSALSLVNAEDQWTSESASITRAASLNANSPTAGPAVRIAINLGEEAAEMLEQERWELLVGKQMSLTNGIGISGDNPELAAIQAKDLYWKSSLFVSMEKMHECFFTVHPDWRPENFQATVMRMWEAGGSKGHSGDTRDWLNGVIRDQLGRYDRDLGVYEAAMLEILQKGVDACLKIRQGQPEGPLFRELDELITARGYWEAVGRLKGIGVSLSDRHQVIAEASRIIVDYIDIILFRKSEEVRLRQNYDLRQQSNAAWKAEHGGLTNVTVLETRKTVASGYTQKEVSESEQRRLQRAADLVLQARKGNDSRVQMYVDISDDPNIQRERTLANGTKQIVITTAEAETIATEMEKVSRESGGDATEVAKGLLGNPTLIVMRNPDPEIEVVETIATNLGTIPAVEGKSGAESLRPLKGKESSFTFTLEAPMMVNAWMEPGMQGASWIVKGFAFPTHPNYSLELTGTLLAGGSLTPCVSEKPVGAAESVSTVLPAGTYKFTVRDRTVYPAQPAFGTRGQYETPTIPVRYEMKPYKTQKIEGRISIESRDVSMPVSMSVAEFENGQRITDYNKVSKLDPSKPVWVVIPGMNSHEDDGGIEAITRELAAYGDIAGQEVTINWELAAQDITRTGQNAPWTKAVGEWAGQQLIAAGFAPDMINFVGHSHGTFVAYAAASEVMHLKNGAQINSIVALDPAGNVRGISGFDDGEIRFDTVSRNSVAIEGSWITGSNRLASTADVAFQIDSPSTYAFWTEHSLPVTTFANILRSERLMPGQFPHALSLNAIMTPADRQSEPLELNAFRDFYEGIITIDTRPAKDRYGDYLEALPTKTEWRQQGNNVNKIRNIVPADATIK